MIEFATLPKTIITEKPFGDGETVFTIEQDNLLGETVLVDLHPIHLRHMCKQAAIASDRVKHSEQTIAALKRRLDALARRIEFLRHYLVNLSDDAHADLDFEQSYAAATAALAEEFMIESGMEFPYYEPPEELPST